MVRFVSVMVQSHAVELFEWICNLSTRRGESRIQWHALHLARAHAETLVRAIAANIDTVRFFDVAEIESVNAATLVGNDRRLRVAKKSPGGAAKEWVILHVRGSGARAETAQFIFDKKLTDERLAETSGVTVSTTSMR